MNRGPERPRLRALTMLADGPLVDSLMRQFYIRILVDCSFECDALFGGVCYLYFVGSCYLGENKEGFYNVTPFSGYEPNI